MFQEATNEPTMPSMTAAKKPAQNTAAAKRVPAVNSTPSNAPTYAPAAHAPTPRSIAPVNSAPQHTSPAMDALTLEVTELKLSVENLERERDFYYTKLREVEILCQQHEGEKIPFLEEVLQILYKTDDEDFVEPEQVA